MPNASSIRNGSSRRCSGCVSTRVSLTPAPSEVGCAGDTRSTARGRGTVSGLRLVVSRRHCILLRYGTMSIRPYMWVVRISRPKSESGPAVSASRRHAPQLERAQQPRSSICSYAEQPSRSLPRRAQRQAFGVDEVHVGHPEEQPAPVLKIRRPAYPPACSGTCLRASAPHKPSCPRADLRAPSPCSGTSRRPREIASIQFLSGDGTPKLYIGTPSTTTSAAWISAINASSSATRAACSGVRLLGRREKRASATSSRTG